MAQFEWKLLADLRGVRGYSISSATVGADGRLRLGLDSGLVLDAGYVRGTQGLPGTNGNTADAAVAGYIGTEGTSETKTALGKSVEAQVAKLVDAYIEARLHHQPSYGTPPSSLLLERAPSTTTLYAGDSFTGAAGSELHGRTSSLGTPQVWNTLGSSWRLDGAGWVVPATTDNGIVAVLGVPTENASLFSVEVKTQYRVSGQEGNSGGIVVRYVDPNNFWYFNPMPTINQFRLYRRVGGVDKVMGRVATPEGIVNNSVVTMRVDIWGRDITCYIDGKVVFTYSSVDGGLGSSKVGLRQGMAAAGGVAVKFGGFNITNYKGAKLNVPRLDPYTSEQVVDRGAPGSWEETDINNPNVTWDPINHRWVLQYSGYKGTNPVPIQGMGIATATTLHGPWTKHPQNPLVPPTNGNVENGGLLWVRGRWLRSSENDNTGTSSWSTSPDLINWTAFEPVGFTREVHDPFLRMLQSGVIECWYGVGSPNASIYRASSSDGGLTWTDGATPILGPPPFGAGTYRGNGEPTAWSPPGKEGTELMVFVDVSEEIGKSMMCAAITLDARKTWHWRVIAGGSGSGFDSFQKFDSMPVFHDGVFHLFHAGGVRTGTGVNLDASIGHMAVQWFNPDTRVAIPAPAPYQ
jgi:hypothetical protein